jgi:hypothetical protein
VTKLTATWEKGKYNFLEGGIEVGGFMIRLWTLLSIR